MATRAEIEAKHAGKTWSCAGPLALSQARRDLATKRYDEALALVEKVPADPAGAATALRTLGEALDAYLKEIREPGLTAEQAAALADPATGYQALALLVVGLIRWHRGCGASLTAAMHALPYDGKEHVLVCPTCGTEAKVTRPLPDEDRADTAAAAGATLDEALGS